MRPLSTFSKHYFNFFSRIPQFFFSLKTHSKSVGSVFGCGRIAGIVRVEGTYLMNQEGY